MTKTAIFSTDSKEITSYFPMYHNVMSAKTFTDLKTGEEKKLKAEWKILWCYSLDRFKFFKESHREWFDNQADIADACGVSENTVQRFFKEMTATGYVQTKTTRISGHKSNSYVITQDLVVKTVKTKTKKIALAIVEKSKPSTNAVETNSTPWELEPIPLSAYEDFEPVSVTEDEFDF